MRKPLIGLGSLAVLLLATSTPAQRGQMFADSPEHPAIRYASGPTDDAIAGLAERLRDGRARLAFDERHGYLSGVLEALHVPAASQVVVFSATSQQAALVSPRNPRAIYFTDTVAVGWVPGADALELIAVDPQRGPIFYTLPQRAATTPEFHRESRCLLCHHSRDTLGVPGLLVTSVFRVPADDDRYGYASGIVSDHRIPLSQRWGGWFVTGPTGRNLHLANDTDLTRERHARATPEGVASLRELFDAARFPAATSEAAALMMLEHQATMTNLVTRTGWEARVHDARPSASQLARVREAASELVDYLLFVDEAPLAAPLPAAGGFATWFAAQGPHDRRGRTLRQVDLRTRLLRYPCSYLIHAAAFDAMPLTARDAVYARLWEVLSGRERSDVYARLSPDDRRAVVEILRDTKPGLPDYFRAADVD